MSSAMSDEVAEDYRIALEALTLNSRYEISNLTVIAKENTEHALAISEALKDHIKTTSPQKKLPSFYVLDSVVKNVGTPYTLFFGRQLYTTFMEAYALVDNNVRRKMDEMLKTWKEPVPGSMDTRPVFPPEVTRPIENALIKAKTSFLQAHQEHMRTQQMTNRGRQQPPQPSYRETPTPPNVQRPIQPQSQPQPQHQLSSTGSNYPTQHFFPPENQSYPVPFGNQAFPSLTNGHQYPSAPTVLPFSGQPGDQQYIGGENFQPGSVANRPQYDNQSRVQPFAVPLRGDLPYGQFDARQPNQQYGQPTTSQSNWQQFTPQGFQSGEASRDTLNSDVERLIAESKAAWARNMQDTAASTRLKALLDLQSILQNQKLPPDQIALIRNQVAQLSEASKAHPVAKAPSTPAIAPSFLPPQNSLDSLLGPGALAALLSRQSASPQFLNQPSTQLHPPQSPSTQTPYQFTPQTTCATPNANSSNSLGANGNDASNAGSNAALLDKLRAAGIIGGSTATDLTPNTAKPVFPTAGLPTPSPRLKAVGMEIPKDLVLKSASLKIPRPHLISSLYEKLGVPCSQCGRRFLPDIEGKKKKEAHMDWHFRVRRRMEEAEMRGQHRSWYVDELDWIKSREIEQETVGATSEPANIPSTSTALKVPPLEYIPVPDDAASANCLCPICQEKFEMIWLDEAQEFVWMDAKVVGEKTYHASCYAEVSKNISSQVGLGNSEQTVLGKRKADDELMTFKTKIKSEPLA
ncbi:mRNA cleavage factor complex component Pcf11 [Blumeria hordei DH14]|uniref:mRNA cleavage factor complex component Pcf11 n=1 Tax=Blumeria graminis f. sp. hordei (strain DH14) TaxID=546991 RepID=N1JGU4_BLUG1|nr:mRNA cleavage factor complex component Pcf11 [Blumeria hordei DH14]